MDLFEEAAGGVGWGEGVRVRPHSLGPSSICTAKRPRPKTRADLTVLPTLGGNAGAAYDINNAGEIRVNAVPVPAAAWLLVGTGLLRLVGYGVRIWLMGTCPGICTSVKTGPGT